MGQSSVKRSEQPSPEQRRTAIRPSASVAAAERAIASSGAGGRSGANRSRRAAHPCELLAAGGSAEVLIEHRDHARGRGPAVVHGLGQLGEAGAKLEDLGKWHEITGAVELLERRPAGPGIGIGEAVG